MTFSTYDGLKTEIMSWAHSDTITDAVAATCVQLAETYLNDELRTADQITSATLSLTAGSTSVAMPADFIESVSLDYADTASLLEQRPVTEIMRLLTTDIISGRPTKYCVAQSYTAYFNSKADQTYSLNLRYYAKLDLASSSTNWALTNYPNLYLYAALEESARYLRDVNALQLWATKKEEIIERIKLRDHRARKGARLTVDPALITRGVFNINTGTY